MFNAARSIDDEPSLICFLVRVAGVQATLGSLERMLAQGELTDPELAAWQELLADEAAQPLFLAALRGERAGQQNVAELLYDGELDLEGVGNGGGRRSGSAYQWGLVQPMVRLNQVHLLELMTEAIEIAKRPPAEHRLGFAKWDAKVGPQATLPYLALSRMLVPALPRMGNANLRFLAALDSARTALAAERYRLANNRWPVRLDDVVPRYLAAVPDDPFSKGKLRWDRRDTGWTVYALGEDAKDNGGDVDRKPGHNPLDVGFRLWDPATRRQPPAK
jgi:hypothetical protein